MRRDWWTEVQWEPGSLATRASTRAKPGRVLAQACVLTRSWVAQACMLTPSWDSTSLASLWKGLIVKGRMGNGVAAGYLEFLLKGGLRLGARLQLYSEQLPQWLCSQSLSRLLQRGLGVG